MPRISILLTCYNHFRWLPEALEGVRSQTFTDYEVIAIDDCSSDATRQYLSKQTDVRCLFNKTNIGTYATLNAGLAEAKGEYIAVLNDDDVWEPTKLARQVELLDAHPDIALCHTGGQFIDSASDVVQGNPLGFAFPRFETGDILLGLVYENKIIASAAMARRSVFDELGGFNDSYFGSGDWEMWFRIAEKYHVGFVDEMLTNYRIHDNQASKKLDQIWIDDQRLREWFTPRLDKFGDRFPIEDTQRAKAFNQAALGMERGLNGDPQGARKAFVASIRLQPSRWKSYARWISTFLPTTTFRKTLRL